MFRAKDRNNLDRTTWTQLKFLLFVSNLLRSSGNQISFPHPSQDSTSRIVETRTRMGQSHQWRQWKVHQGLGTGNGTVRYIRDKQVARRESTWGHNGTSCILRHIIGGYSSSSIHQDNQEPRNKNSFSGKKTNNSQTRTASSTLCSKIEENNRGRKRFQFAME